MSSRLSYQLQVQTDVQSQTTSRKASTFVFTFSTMFYSPTLPTAWRQLRSSKQLHTNDLFGFDSCCTVPTVAVRFTLARLVRWCRHNAYQCVPRSRVDYSGVVRDHQSVAGTNSKVLGDTTTNDRMVWCDGIWARCGNRCPPLRDWSVGLVLNRTIKVRSNTCAATTITFTSTSSVSQLLYLAASQDARSSGTSRVKYTTKTRDEVFTKHPIRRFCQLINV